MFASVRNTTLCVILAAVALTLLVRVAAQADDLGIVVRTQGEVRYVSGGVGLTERQTLKEIAARERMNLKLEFAEGNGAFLAALPVTITDASGVVRLRVKTDGPWLFVRLPAGDYTYRAERDGIAQAGSVTVPVIGRVERLVSFP